MEDKLTIQTLNQDIGDAIKYTKSQQWLTTYYGLLLQAALIGGFKVFKELLVNTSWGDVVLYIITVLIITFIILIIINGNVIFNNYKGDLDRYRKIVISIASKVDFLSENYKELEKDIKELKVRPKKVDEQEKITINTLKIAFNIISYAAILYYILYIATELFK